MEPTITRMYPNGPLQAVLGGSVFGRRALSLDGPEGIRWELRCAHHAKNTHSKSPWPQENGSARAAPVQPSRCGIRERARGSGSRRTVARARRGQEGRAGAARYAKVLIRALDTSKLVYFRAWGRGVKVLFFAPESDCFGP